MQLLTYILQHYYKQMDEREREAYQYVSRSEIVEGSERQMLDQDFLSSLSQRLEQAKEAIYENLAIVRDQQQGIQFTQKYEQISALLEEIRTQQESLEKHSQSLVIKQAVEETQSYKADTLNVDNRLKQRLKRRQSQCGHLLQLVGLVKVANLNTKYAELQIKHERLLQKSIKNLRQLKEQLFQLHQKEGMFRNIKLKNQNDNNQYILNLIKKDAERQLKDLKEKREVLNRKVGMSDVQAEQLGKYYNEALDELNKSKINLMLRSEPRQPRVYKAEKKMKKVEHNRPKSIPAPEPIRTEILLFPYNWKYEMGAGVFLSLLTVLLLLQLI